MAGGADLSSDGRLPGSVRAGQCGPEKRVEAAGRPQAEFSRASRGGDRGLSGVWGWRGGQEFECEAFFGFDAAGFDVVDFFDLADEGLPAFEEHAAVGLSGWGLAEWFHGVDAEFECCRGHFAVQFVDVSVGGSGILQVLLPAFHAGGNNLLNQLWLFADDLFCGDEQTGVGVEADVRDHQDLGITALFLCEEGFAEDIGLLGECGFDEEFSDETVEWDHGDVGEG